jgi:subtilase family protein
MRRVQLYLAVSLALCAQVATAQNARRSFLFKDSRGELAAARARGDSTVLLVIAAVPGGNARVAKAIAALGGRVRFRDDDVDYLRARVPVDSVEALVRHPAVFAADINVYSNRSFSASESPEPSASVPVATPSMFASSLPSLRGDTIPAWPPTWSDYPLTNRYDPLGDMGALEFRKANPTFDGRGVTIALIDMNPDPLLPELQVATSIDGKRIPKVAFYETALDGEEEDGAGRWLAMRDSVVAAGGRFTLQGKTYTAPRDGMFRVAMLDEAKYDTTDNVLAKDLNRDGNKDGTGRLFAVLWDEKTNDVWVDTDQDLSFTDEKALSDYRTRPEFGVFGTDDPKTPVRESVAFAVQIDKARKMVGINAGVASHASLVVGAVLASKGTAGRFDGVAPGAQLASVSEGGAAYGQTEAVIQAIKNPKIDIAFLEQSSVITHQYILRDGRLVPTVIYGRLIEKYGKPILIPTHNFPIVNASDDIILAKGAIGIGAHESKANFFTNFGLRVEHDDGLHTTGGYGPMGNGAMAPSILSPSNIMSTRRGWEAPSIMAGVYQLPPGYMIAGGTSTATPTASGGVALLISAAKQRGIKHDAARIRQAVTMSARYVPHLPEYKQGNGVIDIAAAWAILQALDTAKTPAMEIVVSAPVKHSYSRLLATPDQGVGLYERDGWTAGTRGERTISLRRTSGPKGPMTFALSWLGNEGNTFSGPASVTLPLGVAVPVTLAIAPAQAGVHSALLTLDHPSVPGHAHRMLATVIAAEPLAAMNGYTVEVSGEVPRVQMRSWFYRVPEGASALRIDVDAPKRELTLGVFRPDTRAAAAVRTMAAAGGRGGGGGGGPQANRPKSTYVVTDPMPGVWEIRLTDVEDARTYDHEAAWKPEIAPATKVTLTVAAIAADVNATSTMGDNSGPAAGAAAGELTVTNRMAELRGGLSSLALGAARRDRPTIRDKEQQVYEIDVPAGTATLLARIARPSDAAADLDVFVYDCTKQCRPAGAAADPVGDASVVVQNPAAGKWKVVVDGWSVPSGSTTYDYLDVIFNPTFGMAGVADASELRKAGAQWTVKSTTWAAGELPAGRVPYASVLLQTQPAGADRLILRYAEVPPSR